MIDTELERLTNERTALEAKLASPATYTGDADPVSLRRRLDELLQKIAAAEGRWMEAEEEIDRLEAA